MDADPPPFFALNGRIFCDLTGQNSEFFGPTAPSGTAGEYFYQIYDDKITFLTASTFSSKNCATERTNATLPPLSP